MDEIVKLETLDTTYVNLSALIRYLRDNNFAGRLHLSLGQYEADVFLYPSVAPSVWEEDRATGRSARGDGALDRLLVRAREPGGQIKLYIQSPGTQPTGPRNGEVSTMEQVDLAGEVQQPESLETDWDHLIKASAELIAAIERAVVDTGQSFPARFHAARVALGDDYPFIDPTLGGFEYADGQVDLDRRPSAAAYVNGIVECLRFVTNNLAKGKGASGVRERVAAELALAARKQANAMADFTPHLDRIAGTRVI